MDVLKFLKSGNISKNPNYNPKTKEGKLHSPLLVDYKPGESVSDKLRSSIASNMSKNIYGLDSEQIDKYAEYNTYLNPFDSQEELNRERAENQSALEQLGNFAVQAIGNEVVLGTLLGVSNIVDAALNIGPNKGKDDYSNPVSLAFEEAQNAIRERFEIYRKDPNQTWAISDFGWWADNAVSIASTASMLLPSIGIAKGLGAIGNLTKAGKITRGIAKMATKTPKAASKLARQMNSALELGTTATLSRTMEGYLESRDVYKSAYDETLSELKKMSVEEKEKLFINNPELLKDATTDEEIASRIASVSADETFRNDYAMLLFDIIQFKALPNIWKGKNTVATAKERLINRNVISNIGKESKKLADDITFMATQKEAIKGVLRNPLTSLTAIEWSEGIEEGYQGIQVEKGKEKAKKILDPTFIGRTLDSYLKDFAIWEQVVWGIMGGMGFQAVGKGLGKLEKQISKGIDKISLSEQDFNLKHSAEELTKRTEIESRNARFNKFYEDMQKLNNLENPFKDTVYDEFGKPYESKLTPEQADKLKEKYITSHITDMVLDAADAGNWDLFKDYINSKEFTEYNKQNLNGSDQAAFNNMLQQMEEIYDRYHENMYYIFDTIDVKNPNIAQLMARYMTRAQNNIEATNKDLNNLYAEFNKAEDATSADLYKQQAKLKYLNQQLNLIDVYRDVINKDENLSKEAKELYNKEYNKLEKVLVEELKSITGYNLEYNVKDELSFAENATIRNQFLTDLFNFSKEFYKSIDKTVNASYVEPTNTIKNIANQINTLEDRLARAKHYLPTGQEQFQELYDEFSITHDKLVRKTYDDAVDKVGKWIESQEDLVSAKKDILTGNVPDELKDSVKLLKLGYHTTKNFYNRLDNIINETAKVREETKAKAEEVTVNGKTETSETTKSKVAEVANTPAPTETAQKPYTKDTNGEWFEVGDEIEGTNYDIDGNISKNPNSIWRAKIIKVYDNGSIKVEGGAEFTPTMIREFFGLPVPKIKGATSRFTYNSRLGKPRTQSPPSTGGVSSTSTDSEIVAVTEEEYNEVLDDLKGTAVAEISKEEEDAFNKNLKEIAKINESLKEVLKDENLKQSLIGKDTSSAEYNQLYQALKDKLIENGIINVNENNIKEAANNALSLINFIANDSFESSIFMALNNAIFEDTRNEELLKDMIDKYLSTLVKDDIDISDLKPIINAEDLFKYLIKNNLVTYYQAKILAQELIEYAKKPNENYIFQDINSIDKLDALFANIALEDSTTVLDNSMHVKPPTKFNEDLKNKLLGLKPGTKLIAVRTGNSISLRTEDGTEISYLGVVKRNDTGNKFSLVAEPNVGFLNIVWENDGEYFSSTDNFFINLIDGTNDDYKELYRLIYKDYIHKIDKNTYPELTKEEKEKVYDLVFKYAGDCYTFLSGEKTKGANRFLVDVQNILFYNKLNSKSIKKKSYKDWVKNIYDNFSNTYEIQQMLNNGNDNITIEYAGMSDVILLVGDNYQKISEINLDPKANPIICRLQDERRLSIEGSDMMYENKPGFDVGMMGFLIQDSNGAPMVAKVIGDPLTDNKNIANKVGEEIVDILTNFQKGIYSFEEVYARLLELLGSNQTKDHYLFKGYNVILTNNRIILNIDGTDKFNLVIHKFKNGTNDLGTGISYNPDGNREGSKAFSKVNNKVIKAIASEIVQKLSFNTTFYPIINNNNLNTTGNRYIFKRDGKFVFSIGGIEKEYDSFGHFAIENNIFSTNQHLNSAGGYFTLETYAPNSIYIKVTKVESPVKEEDPTPIDILMKDEGKGVSTIDILRAAKEDENYIDFLINNIELVPKVVFYDKVLKGAAAYYNAQKNRIYITEEGANNSKPDAATGKGNGNIIRLLLHENVHKQLRKTKDIKREEIVNGLIETYNMFINAINNDTTEEGKAFRDWIEASNFSPDNYYKNLSEADQAKWNKKSKKEQLAIFAEEWLAECLSQKPLINYLNNVTIEEDIVIENADDNKKTLFQKIIELVLKLFGKNYKNIQNNTILAKQYSLFADASVAGASNEQTSEAQTANDAGVATSLESNPTDLIDEFADEITNDNENLFATTEPISKENSTIDEVLMDTSDNNATFIANGADVVKNMESYIKQFPLQDQPIISQMVAKNQIKFVC